MFSFLSALIGMVALLLALPAAVPLLGWGNWLVVPLALLGALIGQLARGNGARNFCLVVAALAALRLWLGGGFI